MTIPQALQKLTDVLKALCSEHGALVCRLAPAILRLRKGMAFSFGKWAQVGIIPHRTGERGRGFQHSESSFQRRAVFYNEVLKKPCMAWRLCAHGAQCRYVAHRGGRDVGVVTRASGPGEFGCESGGAIVVRMRVEGHGAAQSAVAGCESWGGAL